MYTAVRVRGVRVELDRTEIIAGIGLEVAAGSWVTIIGPNGAGKSTLLRAIGGLVRYTGEVELFGTALERLRRRERARLVATVPQDPVVPPGMSVLDYALLGRTPYIRPLASESATDLDVVADVLDLLDLGRFAGRRLESLSGGERQRVFLARALAQGAKLLLLDEPTTALDIGHQQDVLELVDRMRHERGLTVLSTMHDLSVAGEYAEQMVLLAAGGIVASGTPREVLTEELLGRHYKARVRVVEGGQGPLVVPVREP
jgi:iron complex transport system ATP-binding protein